MPSERQSIARAEWRFAWLVTGALSVLVLASFVYGYLVTPAESVFLGVSASSPADNLIYFSYIEQARHTGHAFFWNVFSQEPSTASFFSPLWAVLGYAAGLFHLSTPTIFVIALVASTMVYGLGVYWALATFIPHVRTRQIAFVTLFFASGVGFVVAVLPVTLALGSDLTYIPGFVLPTLLHSPLQALSQLLLICAFALFIQTERLQAPRVVLYGAVSLLALLHPYDLVPLFIACVGYAAATSVQKKSATAGRHAWQTVVYMSLVSLPIGAYFLTLRWIDVGVGGWLRQNVTLSPTPVQMLLGFGPLLILAGIGITRQWMQRGRALTLLTLWAIAVPLLTYVPIPFQSRFANGYSVALVLLAAPVLLRVLSRVQRPTFLLWLALLIMVFIPTTLYNYVSTFRRYTESAKVAHDSVYPPKDIMMVTQWLQAQPRSVLVSQYATSRVFSALSLQPSYQADSHQTVRYPEKARAWEALLANPSALRSFMQSNAITYFVETSHMQRANPEVHKAAQQTLRKAIALPGITLYEIGEATP